MKKYDILALNKSWIPIHIITWKVAISLIYQEKVHSLDRDMIAYGLDDWLAFTTHNADDYYKVKGSSMAIAIPEVIVSTTFNKLPTRHVKYSRQNVFSRDNFTCAYCGKGHRAKDLTIDHIIPRDQNGKTTWDNVISACFSCNQKKANRTPEQAKMWLKFEPKKPKWFSPLDNFNVETHPCKSWQHFMKRMDTDISVPS